MTTNRHEGNSKAINGYNKTISRLFSYNLSKTCDLLSFSTFSRKSSSILCKKYQFEFVISITKILFVTPCYRVQGTCALRYILNQPNILQPELKSRTLEQLYGFASSRKEKELWNKLVVTKLVNRLPLKWPGTGHVNMTEFFSSTSPMYYVTHCKLEHIDCRKYWRKVLTLNGACIEFDPILAIQG